MAEGKAHVTDEADDESWSGVEYCDSYEDDWLAPAPTEKPLLKKPLQRQTPPLQSPAEIRAMSPLEVGHRLWLETNHVKARVEEVFPQIHNMITTFNEVDMTLLATHFTLQHRSFEEQKRSTAINVGYHFTNAGNLQRISTDGLLTKEERDRRGIDTKFNGSAFGDGVYTADNPKIVRKYGNTGLLVARLAGLCATRWSVSNDSHDTYIAGPIKVLRNSAQCCVLIQFPKRLLELEQGGAALELMRHELQEMLWKKFWGPPDHSQESSEFALVDAA